MILRKGDKGDNVKFLQEKLMSFGFSIKADGVFGSATEKAVKSFQGMKNLEADGVAGRKTLSALDLVFVEKTSNRRETPSGKKIILVSAGHSTVPPRDPGAIGSGYVEATEAVRLRDSIATRLRAKGVIVLEDGVDGESDPLKKAIGLARQSHIAIEIHFNGNTKPSISGVEVYAKTDKRNIAQSLAAAIADATGLKTRGGDGGYRPDNSGQHQRLGFCEAGGLVVEVCFISNADDMRRYSQNFDKIAENISDVLGR